VLVSAWFWKGKESKNVELAERGLVSGYSSPQLIDEFRKVLMYPKFKLTEDEISSALGYYELVLRVVLPRTSVDAINEDPADNEVLACALSAGADIIITGDKHLLALGEYKGTKISTSAGFLESIGLL
jgi:putative PIN family toxin of toxin-antitoxin system